MENRSEQEIIYGRHPVMEALRSGRPVQRLYVLAKATGIPRDLFVIARERAIPVVHTDRFRLDNMTHRANHQGVAASIGVRDFSPLQEVLERPLGTGVPPFFLMLDGVQDPGNFGALLRTAECAGVHGVIVAGEGSCGFTGVVSKASAGADQYLPVARVAKLTSVLRDFREYGYEIVGADMEGENYAQADFTKPMVMILGAEGRGLSKGLKELCTRIVSIPLAGKVESLNVSAAGAVLMYEVVRQRNKS